MEIRYRIRQVKAFLILFLKNPGLFSVAILLLPQLIAHNFRKWRGEIDAE